MRELGVSRSTKVLVSRKTLAKLSAWRKACRACKYRAGTGYPQSLISHGGDVVKGGLPQALVAALCLSPGCGEKAG
jgi:hypothetical protein